jgi:hypothetical protein
MDRLDWWQQLSSAAYRTPRGLRGDNLHHWKLGVYGADDGSRLIHWLHTCSQV